MSKYQNSKASPSRSRNSKSGPAAKNENDAQSAIEKLLEIRTSLAPINTISDEVKRIYGPKIYKIAYLLNADDDQWQAFCEHSDWQNESPRPKFQKSPRKNLISFVTKFAVGAGSMSSARRAGMFNRLLKPFWETETLPKAVADKIREQQEEKKRASAKRRAERNRQKLAIHFEPGELSQQLNSCPALVSGGRVLVRMRLRPRKGNVCTAQILAFRDKVGDSLTIPKLKKQKPTSGGKGTTPKPPSGGKGKG
ncbi:hypothetical protein [Rhizobium sp. NRK18]|uniref:hypothetical protein n=1 Tax=Rhizobium sp. NRK18 TaxID=2964667 RepID=UPI0021C3B269|nr:hypothetical protein [Rhizobium sp. NRK18]MCQ2002369.1 hypothetical protein [Rhizobium sp. NRK18]